jgi:micrococcal nuclease
VASPAYRYAATVVNVHDGDTVRADVDLGFGIWKRAASFRLLGLNAIELGDPGGREARDNLTALVLGRTLTLTSVKPDKYGDRYDSLLALPDGADVAALLINAGWAAPWNGTGPRPLPLWPRPV